MFDVKKATDEAAGKSLDMMPFLTLSVRYWLSDD